MSLYPTSYTVQHFHADDGSLLSGGSLEFFISGTTTPTPAYMDAAGTFVGVTIDLNSRGEPEVSGNAVIIWLSTNITYKVIAKNASGATEWTVEGLSAGSSASLINSAIASSDFSQWPTISVNASDTDHDIDFNPGVIADSTGSALFELGSTMTKRLDAAWASGTGSGGLFSGSVASDTLYYCFLIEADFNDVIDCGFDTDSSAANRPAGFTHYRRIASFNTDGSGNIDASSVTLLLNAEIARRGENNGTASLDKDGLIPYAQLPTDVDSTFTSLQNQITNNDSDILDLQNNKADLIGTYPSLRAQATTKADVGLGSVNNYGASSSVTSSSSTTYATSLAAKTAFDEANKALSSVTLFTGSTTGDLSLSQAYTNFRWLVLVAGETDWGSAIVIDTGAISKAWERSSSKYVHAVGSDGFIEILQSGTTSTYLNMGGSLRGVVTAVYGVGDF